jgi:phosphohistidine swiveling domain-containing protein
LAGAGFSVPAGFLLLTSAYRAFVAHNELGPVIDSKLETLDAQDPDALEAASVAIRKRFAAGTLPPELEGALREAYAALGEPPVAVRSSATAEDLPELSFAGQGLLGPMTPLGQDTVRAVFAGGGRAFGIHHLTAETQAVVHSAAERLFVDITGLLRNRVGRRMGHAFLGIVALGVQQALTILLDDPRLGAPGRPTPKTVRRAARFVVPVIAGVVRALLWPEASRVRFQEQTEARRVRWAARRMRAVAGLRESRKFWIVRFMGLVRAALLDSGADLARAGVLGRSDDLFFLTLRELRALAAGAARDWRTLVGERRAVYEREERRIQVPRLRLSDGQAFYEGVTAPTKEGEGVLAGSPVSPGIVEGRVRVVLDPHAARLQPGEIMVCPGTDPAWTPLFLPAGGRVMEVGGLVTHGSVVAREYGIPAVVGVTRACERLRTGQRVRVDGASGWVTLLEEE